MYSEEVLQLNPQLPRKAYKRRYSSPEHDLQANVFLRCTSMANIYPVYGLVYAIPNGQYRAGQRPEPGIKTGVPDIFWAHPSGGFHGMYIELKAGKNNLGENQEAWITALREQGYYCIVIWDSADRVLECMEAYRQGEIKR